MKRDYLIKKWLDNELNANELEAFKKLEDYGDLVKLSENLQYFKASDFDSEEELNAVLHKINTHKTRTINWYKPLLRIAAVFAIAFAVYYYTAGFDTNIQTLASQKSVIELPDLSEVMLNAESSLTYNKTRWKRNRDVELDGEAYFKVAKGSTFNVLTEAGTVTVLGTEFNVKNRTDFFEVICFEGSVGVTYKEKSVTLKPGYSFLIIDGTIYAKDIDARSEPSWINDESYFRSLPYDEVLAELQRQYNITIISKDVDSEQLFTGTFKHNNLELALKSVTLPLNLSYHFSNDTTIVLSRE